MTSKFAISRHGVIPEYHSNTQDACLVYDNEMSPCEAFEETMDLIKLDFNEVMPILVTQILSLLQPVVEDEKLYSIPGLFLSGATSTGKTELALAFGTLFGNFVTKDLKNFLILQSGVREFEQRQRHFSDTTFILDDARKSPAYSVCQSIVRLIDTLGRSTFTKNSTRLTPIVTGEPQSLSVYLESLRNRFVEIYMDSSEEKMSCRKILISKMKENPLLLRTCLLHFIIFICENIHSAQLSREIRRIKEDFGKLFENQTNRSHDNLCMHYLGFRLFFYYGKSVCRFTNSEIMEYEERYKQVLTDIGKHSDVYSDKGRGKIFIQFLCNSIKAGRIKIYKPQIANKCFFPHAYYNYEYGYEYDCEQLSNSYGHFAVIDMDHDFHGIYIQKQSSLPGCSGNTADLPVLLLNIRKVFEVLEYENTEFQIHHGYKPLPLNHNKLKQLLLKQRILFVEKRYEPGNDYYNYTCQYPHWINEQLCCDGVFCINIKVPIATELADCIHSLPEPDIPEGCLYKSTSTPESSMHIGDLEKACSSVSTFR